MTAYPTPQAIVLSDEGVFYDTGRHHRLNGRLNLSDISQVLGGAETAFRGREGVVVVVAQMPETIHQVPELLNGWEFTELRAWTTFRRPGSQPIHVGWLPELEAQGRLGALLEGHKGPADLAWRLGRYAMLVGSPWLFTAGVSACAGLRAGYVDPRPGKQPLWHFPPLVGIKGAGPLIWRAKVQPTGGKTIIHGWDINAMYLAGIKNASVAWGGLARASARFDHSMPGFWEIDVSRVDPGLYDGLERPPLFHAARVHNGAIWLSTPTAKLLSERAGSLDVLDCYVSENGQTIGRPFAERVMAARRGDLGPVGPVEHALKRTYAELVGMVARPGGSIHRADWSAHWMDLSRANMLRRVERVGIKYDLWPVAVQVDAVYYAQPEPAAPGRVMISEVLGEGTSPGLFKYQGVLTVDAYRNKFGLAA